MKWNFEGARQCYVLIVHLHRKGKAVGLKHILTTDFNPLDEDDLCIESRRLGTFLIGELKIGE